MLMKIKTLFKEPSTRLIGPFIILAIWMACLHLRPLCILFLSILAFWYYKTQCNWRIVPPPELKQHWERLIKFVIMDREDSKMPIIFFLVVMSGLLFYIPLILWIAPISVMATVAFYNFKITKLCESETRARHAEIRDTEYEDDSEFMPEVDDCTKFVLENASTMTAPISVTDDDTLNGETDDELPSDSIPDLNDSSTDEEVEKLLPAPKNFKPIYSPPAAPADSAAATDQLEDSDAMRFRKGHFKRDSSLSTSASSSEESLSKGLKFPDVTAVDGVALRKLPAAETEPPAPAVALLQSNAAKLLPNLVSGIVQWSIGTNSAVIATESPPAVPAVESDNLNKPRNFTALESSDDESEFEIVDKDEYLK